MFHAMQILKWRKCRCKPVKTQRVDGWAEARHQDEGGNVAPDFFCMGKWVGRECKGEGERVRSDEIVEQPDSKVMEGQ